MTVITMLEFLAENYGSIIVGAALIVIIALIIRKLVRDKRAGKCSCGSCSACGKGCSGCSCGACDEREK
ncbi:MAG: FeoB-associated Cys-rich membrane protein [Oscillospiraceae bacterium]